MVSVLRAFACLFMNLPNGLENSYFIIHFINELMHINLVIILERSSVTLPVNQVLIFKLLS